MWNLSKSFDFHGQEVRYDVQGEGEPIVLVHGTPWSSFCWRNLIPHLAQSWKVHYFDLLGYGQSENTLRHLQAKKGSSSLDVAATSKTSKTS